MKSDKKNELILHKYSFINLLIAKDDVSRSSTGEEKERRQRERQTYSERRETRQDRREKKRGKMIDMRKEGNSWLLPQLI